MVNRVRNWGGTMTYRASCRRQAGDVRFIQSRCSDAFGIFPLVLILLFLACTPTWADLIQPQDTQEDEAKLLEKQAALDHRRVWRFDGDQQGKPPVGFSAHTVGSGESARWQVATSPQAASAPHVLQQPVPCSSEGCFHILLADGVTYDFLDLTLRLRPVSGEASATGGVVFSAKDPRNFYAVLVDFTQDRLSVVRVLDGQETVLGTAPITRKKDPWHHVRVQRNTIISKEFIEAYFDHKLTVSVQDQKLGLGQIGLVTSGDSTIEFDNIDAIRIYSQHPLSTPAAY